MSSFVNFTNISLFLWNRSSIFPVCIQSKLHGLITKFLIVSQNWNGPERLSTKSYVAVRNSGSSGFDELWCLPHQPTLWIITRQCSKDNVRMASPANLILPFGSWYLTVSRHFRRNILPKLFSRKSTTQPCWVKPANEHRIILCMKDQTLQHLILCTRFYICTKRQVKSSWFVEIWLPESENTVDDCLGTSAPPVVKPRMVCIGTKWKLELRMKQDWVDFFSFGFWLVSESIGSF